MIRSPKALIDLFRTTGALLSGHFVLRSGLHSREFFQCALLLQYPQFATEVCTQLARHFAPIEGVTVISPALGGIIVGQEVARFLNLRHIFVEKEGDNGLCLRRGFRIQPGEEVLVIEDVVTRGGRVKQTIEVVHQQGGQVIAIGCLVDRSGGNLPDFNCPFVSLLELHSEVFEPDQLPEDLQKIPAVHPGSSGTRACVKGV